jgi:predicted dehydrogenase
MPNRRTFLKATGSIGAAIFVPRHVLGGGGKHVAASDRVNVAIIGAGGQGRTNARALMEVPEARIVAIADPIESMDLSPFYYGGVAGRMPLKEEVEKHYGASEPNFRCAVYADFRELLAKETAIDAVLVSTPDHAHAICSIAAMQRGKHCYCEKPLAHSVEEVTMMAEVAKAKNVATQMGNIGHSSEGIRTTVEWIRHGLIGRVTRVVAWASSPRWNPQLTALPAAESTPQGVQWDLWLGPRDGFGFSSAYHPVRWRDCYPFGGGTLGDLGCHDMDAAVWALGLADPTSIEGYATGLTDLQLAPHGETVYYRFDRPIEEEDPEGLPAASTIFPSGGLELAWYGGGSKPPRPASMPAEESLPGRGVMFFGEKGTMVCSGAGGQPKLYGIATPDPLPKASIARSAGHHRDWVMACRGERPASARFQYGARLTRIVCLGIIAVRLGAKL